MNWYIAKLVYRIVNASDKPQFDEQLRLIRADEWDWAVEKADTIGRLGESIFFNTNLQKVHWQFAGVSDLFQVGPLDDGELLYTETKEPDNPDAYLEQVTVRNHRLRESFTKNSNLNDPEVLEKFAQD